MSLCPLFRYVDSLKGFGPQHEGGINSFMAIQWYMPVPIVNTYLTVHERVNVKIEKNQNHGLENCFVLTPLRV